MAGVNELWVGIISVLLSTNHLVAMSNVVAQQTGWKVRVAEKGDVVERQLQALMEEDDAAHAEADEWIQAEQATSAKGPAISSSTLRGRLTQRLDKVRDAYEAFLKKHPDHAKAHLAYGSFLNDLHEDEPARVHWEKALELDPTNPAAWNNLANYYGHNSPVQKSFEYYAKAIELDSSQPIYYQNFATTVYLFRRDATNYFKITEQEVFAKAIGLYRKALALDPRNFLLATDYAQTYYGIPPMKSGDPEADRQARLRLSEEAMAAWRGALKLARDEIERQGVYVHLARFQITAGQFEAARQQLSSVTNLMFETTKKNLARKLQEKETQAAASAPSKP